MQELNRVPLRALRAVEAVARCGTIAAAAEELRVTPGAVSQQVARAEATLGLALFDRGPRGMTPTPRAAEVCRLLGAGFAQIAAAVARTEVARDEILTISVAPIFAARWLIWRLPRFSAAHPGLRVRLDAELGLVEPGRSDVDLCIRVGRGGWPRVRAERLVPQVIFPVCSPEVAERIRAPADLAGVPIIREPHPMFGWDDWLGPEGQSEAILGDGPVFSDAALCLDAAISGAGVFLTFESVAADPLAHGRIVAPLPGRRATANSYWLVTAADRSLSAPARRFRDWLKDEIAAAGLGRTE